MPDADKPGINYKRRGSRYRARRRAVDMLFEAEARDIDPVAILEDRITLSRSHESGVAPVNPYTKQIVAGAAEELDRIDEVITAHLAEGWTLERISAVDRAVLRVAVWEMLFNEEVPVVTAVVEAVELSSEYSTDDSPAYINALLDAVVQKIDDARAGVPFILPEAEEEDLDEAEQVDFEQGDFEAVDAELATDLEQPVTDEFAGSPLAAEAGAEPEPVAETEAEQAESAETPVFGEAHEAEESQKLTPEAGTEQEPQGDSEDGQANAYNI